MKKIFMFMALLISQLTLANCYKGVEGAVELHSDQEILEQKILLGELVNNSNPEIYRVTNGDSCNLNGCDFSLYIPNKKGCLHNALSAYGSKLTNNYGWKKFTLITKGLPVDEGSDEKVFVYQSKSRKFIEANKK